MSAARKDERSSHSNKSRRRSYSSSSKPAHAAPKHRAKAHKRTENTQSDIPHRRVGSGSTGSLSATNPGHTRSSGTTGSLSAANPNRVASSSGVIYKSSSSSRSDSRRRMPSHAAPAKKKSSGVLIALAVVLVIGIGVGGYFIVSRFFNPFEGANVEAGQTVNVVIPEGSSGADITQILLDAGVIRSSRAFRKAAAEQQADQSFRPGTYTFLTGSDPDEVVRQLVAGPNSSVGQLVVPEGLTITQTAQLVERSLGITQDDFVAQAKASNYVKDYEFLSSAGNDSLEGYLYPKTYDLSGKEATADTVIRLMLDQYRTEVQGLDLTSAEQALSDRYNLNVTDYDILKIASIIEKEAINEDDRPKVSSVFYNRLSAGQALQSDATMGYVTGGSVSSDDLKQDSAYNTYLHKGLPPTPICSPSLWAIEAAMNPADTDYYFFFIIDDGVYSNHTFSKTYEEHNAAYKEALKEQAAANGNTTEASSS